MIANWIRVFLLTSVIVIAGCSDQGTKPDVSRGPGPSAPALYGSPKGAASPTIARTRPLDLKNDDWKKAPFAVVQTELSPVTLFHATTHELSLFTQMSDSGLGAPTFASFGQIGGPIIVTNGLPMEATTMTENWILVWFAGASGWTNWDSPWLVCLQHKPRTAQLDTNGLRLEFDGEAGYVTMMPLYGYDKPPQSGREFLSAHGLTERKVKTWTWTESIPREVLYRVRYWSEALREFPLYCEDSFSVDRSRDAVTIRQKFQWLSIDDDWKTKHRKLAPISPPLGLVSLDNRFPVEFSKKPFDMDLATPYGPYLCVEDVDSYDATLRVLQYLNETEASDPPNTNAHPSVIAAWKKLNQTAANKFKRGDKYEYDHGGLNNFCWAIQGDGWYAKALPYYDATTRTNALASLRKYFHEDVLVTNRFVTREFPKGSGHDYLILEGPGIGSWGALGDAGKFSANLLETLWTYAHHTGDWDLVKERWPMIKKMFCTPAETRWVGFGRDAIAELGDEAAPCAAFARLAYKVGDMDSYNYACNIFARELVHHYLKQRGADYFRRHQPWHSMEFMDEEVHLTNLWGDTAGWQIDGPKYPEKTGERQFQNRWVRFKDADVARFHRDYLKADSKKELDLLTTRWEPKRKWENNSHGMPSLVQLRSLLLNETPEQLAQLATPEKFTGPPSGEIASCLAVLRASHPTRFERLIPGGEASQFVTGLEREVGGPSSTLTQSVQTGTNLWPRVTWWKSWKTPTGAAWNFGAVRSTRDGPPGAMKTAPLNWNTQVITYELP